VVRSKKKYTTNFTNRQQYAVYRKNFDDPVTKTVWNNIWIDFIKEVIKKIIYENLKYVFPYRMGALEILKRKINIRLNEDGTLNTRILPIDWPSTNALWKEDPKAKEDKILIYYSNTHTAGYIMEWHWDKSLSNFRNKKYYCLDVNRTLDRYLAKALKEEECNLDFYLKY
jgi:hypothetical protein